MHQDQKSWEPQKPGNTQPANIAKVAKPKARASVVFDSILDIMMGTCVVFVAFMAISICADIILRTTIASPLTGLTEVATLLLVYMPFLGAAYALRKERHVVLDSLVTALQPQVRAALTTVTSAAGIIISMVLLYYGASSTVDLLIRRVLSQASIRIPMWLYTVAIPIGGLMLFFQFIRRMRLHWKSWKEGRLSVEHE